MLLNIKNEFIELESDELMDTNGGIFLTAGAVIGVVAFGKSAITFGKAAVSAWQAGQTLAAVGNGIASIATGSASITGIAWLGFGR